MVGPSECDQGLAYYRLYFIDRNSGHIEAFREFEAADDADAIMVAAGWRESQAMELWEGTRQIQAWQPIDSN
jgi:hypothetical protein